MKTGNLIACGMAVIMLYACSSKNDGSYNRRVSLKPHDRHVKGYLAHALEVVDSSFLLDYKGNSSIGEGTIVVRLRSLGGGDLGDYGLKDGNNGPLYLTLCDSAGVPVAGFDDFASEYQGDAALKDLLARKGGTAAISFHVYTYDGRRVPAYAATFVISSRKMVKQVDTSRADTLYYPLKRDWDQVIDNFEESVDEYVRLIRKAHRGDTVARREYPQYLSNARGTEEILVNARADHELTDRQIRRVIRIQDRLVEVAAELQGI